MLWGAVWCGVVRWAAVGWGGVRCGAVWCGEVRWGAVWCGGARWGAVGCSGDGAVRYGVVGCGGVLYGASAGEAGSGVRRAVTKVASRVDHSRHHGGRWLQSMEKLALLPKVGGAAHVARLEAVPCEACILPSLGPRPHGAPMASLYKHAY